MNLCHFTLKYGMSLRDECFEDFEWKLLWNARDDDQGTTELLEVVAKNLESSWSLWGSDEYVCFCFVWKLKLVSVPEMDYRVTDKGGPRGEVWMRGPSIFKLSG